MTRDILPIRRAIISVSDKTGLLPLAQALLRRQVEILSSGGTYKYLKEQGILVQEVSDFTGAPEMLDGRLKTLHPKIHGGILAIRSNATHMRQLEDQKYLPVDLVVVNLYPFEKAAATEGKTFEEVVEQIDIGGPTLLRSAAKNFPFVTVLLEPAQYDLFLSEFEAHGGSTTLNFRRGAARRVFERTANYDATIANFFQRGDETLPPHLPVGLEQKWSLRYGENPHQMAGFYLPAAAEGVTVLERVLQGKTLSYNNLLDTHAALDLINEFEDGVTVAILKHTNPCGVGRSDRSLLEAYQRAYAADPVSAFGGIVIASTPFDGATAEKCAESFLEIVIAPGFDDAARKIFAKKKNLRLLEVDLSAVSSAMGGVEFRRAVDGYLVQGRDRSSESPKEARVVTKRKPTDAEMRALALAWKVARHVKSNAIVLANETETVGIGAGQMSRIDSSKLAVLKADPKKIKGAVLASDAFFPFRDGVDAAAEQGVTAVIEPGGSLRDDEVIAAADEHGLAMLFTDVRHFRH